MTLILDASQRIRSGNGSSGARKCEHLSYALLRSIAVLFDQRPERQHVSDRSVIIKCTEIEVTERIHDVQSISVITECTQTAVTGNEFKIKRIHLFPYTSRRHAGEGGGADIAPLLYNLGTRWREWPASCSDRFTPGK
jgi:hypothetical protein